MSEFSKELDGQQRRINGEKVSINYSDKKFYESFFYEYYSSEKFPHSLSGDAEAVIVRQRKKLRAMGVEMTETVSPVSLSEVSGGSFQDEMYIRKRLSKPFFRKVSFKRKNTRSFEKKQNIFAEANVICPRPGSIGDDKKLCCPHCGKISELRQLEQGCGGCGRASFITDLFPKVRSFFYRKNNSISMRDIGKTIFISCVAGMLLAVPFGVWGFVGDLSGRFTKNTMADSIADVFTAPLEGIMLGVIAAIFILLARLIRDNIKNSALASKTAEAKRRITQTVQEHEKNFCYDDFEGKVVSLLGLVIFSDDRENLAACRLEKPVRKFEIADCIYRGFTELSEIHTEHNICSITLNLHMESVTLAGKRFVSKNDVFEVTVQKKLSDMADTGFELSDAVCPLCFEHYNAVENPECSFCGTRLNTSEHDWVVTDVRIK